MELNLTNIEYLNLYFVTRGVLLGDFWINKDLENWWLKWCRQVNDYEYLQIWMNPCSTRRHINLKIHSVTSFMLWIFKKQIAQINFKYIQRMSSQGNSNLETRFRSLDVHVMFERSRVLQTRKSHGRPEQTNEIFDWIYAALTRDDLRTCCKFGKTFLFW